MGDAHRFLEEHLRKGRLDQAASLALHLLSLDEGDIRARVALARIDAARGLFDRAFQSLSELVSVFPRAPEPLAYLAVLADQKGDTERALLLARRAIALGAEVPACFSMVADHALDEGRHDEAFDLYERALKIAPTLSSAWLGRARILAFRGQLADAEDAYLQALKHGPQRVKAWVELILLERDAGAREIADENLALALRTHPGHPDLLALVEKKGPKDPVEDALETIRQRIFLGDGAGAIHALDRLVIEHPEDERLAIAKAEVLIATGFGDIPPVVHELQRLVRAQPNAWEPKLALGRLLLRPSPLMNPRMAAGYCEDAWRTSGEHPRAGLGLVEAWAAIGKRAFAKALCERLAEGEGPEAEIARDILDGRIEA